MYEQVEKPKENKNRAVANSVAQKKTDVKQGFGFVDNRADAIAQRKLQEVTNSDTQLKSNLKQSYQFSDKPQVPVTPRLLHGVAITHKPIQRRPLNELELKEIDSIKDELSSKEEEFNASSKTIREILDILPSGLPTNIKYFQNRWEWLEPIVDEKTRQCKEVIQLAEEEKNGGWNTSRFKRFNGIFRWLIGSDGFQLVEQTKIGLKRFEPTIKLTARMNNYDNDRKIVLKGGRKNKIDSGVEKIDREITTDALKDDESRIVDLQGWVEVSDIGSPDVTQDDRKRMEGKDGWQEFAGGGKVPEGANDKTSFNNIYKKEAIVILEFYRASWKNFYATDAIFSQWLRSLGKHNGTAFDLPDKFPSVIYQNHIDNQPTILSMEYAMGDERKKQLTKGDDGYATILKSPNGKAMKNLLSSYNEINSARGYDLFQLHTITAYGEKPKLSLKFEFSK
ncbi:hypothetical protein PSECIP111951_00914 [Pseudoalteromonas holothuriae]|uniref:Uncharacterized protein n=1 Tax=Pseudoalteromonas holothuriae TaxID=2963714 RepID=A0A9W4VQB3_9GAMM|nr:MULTISPECIES: hypothetical protein [unclassified Pseudoalteromonas]CAH9053887.1 hypothetical protein PSECIP111951_00914 [Pseudoalteromonas sp. CIP111951]CAH9055727.1 hypothetical protein PSECIP111854_01636 [Pseudoalteromonas sp. CIP111854]